MTEALGPTRGFLCLCPGYSGEINIFDKTLKMPASGLTRLIFLIFLITGLNVIRAQTDFSASWEDFFSYNNVKDFVIVEENPLLNLKALYGTGAIKLTADNEVVRVGGVKYTIKDGIIYDAKRLLADVKAMVDAEKAKNNWKLKQPGIKD